MLHRVFMLRSKVNTFMVSSVGIAGLVDVLVQSSDTAMEIASQRMKQHGGSVIFAGKL